TRDALRYGLAVAMAKALRGRGPRRAPPTAGAGVATAGLLGVHGSAFGRRASAPAGNLPRASPPRRDGAAVARRGPGRPRGGARFDRGGPRLPAVGRRGSVHLC